MAREKYEYMVRVWDDGHRSLIRFGDFDAEAYAYPGKWENVPSLNEIRNGKGSFMDYDDVSEKEAMEILREIQLRYDKKKSEEGMK